MTEELPSAVSAPTRQPSPLSNRAKKQRASHPGPYRQVREAVAIYHSPANLQAAVDELLTRGFDRAQLSLMASEHTVRQKLGQKSFDVRELSDNPETPRQEYRSEAILGNAQGALIGGLAYFTGLAAAGVVIATGGTAIAGMAAALLAAGTGGAIGTVLAKLLGRSHARYFEEQIQKGGIVLWVMTPTPEDERRALDILSRHSSEAVHIHAVADAEAVPPQETPART